MLTYSGLQTAASLIELIYVIDILFELVVYFKLGQRNLV